VGLFSDTKALWVKGVIALHDGTRCQKQQILKKMAANIGQSLRSAVTSVTETVFPMSRSIRDYPRHHLINAGKDL
jgi:hypothetical protein